MWETDVAVEPRVSRTGEGKERVERTAEHNQQTTAILFVCREHYPSSPFLFILLTG